ncbi:hypothetical protein NXS19_004804 [Fusarium pseudograminearum]|nr:hypothetical protein NXS19_004804 [Fusarium pseudograminearum]
MVSPHLSFTLALLSTVTVYFLFRREDEIWSEIICWAILPLIRRIFAPKDKSDFDSALFTNFESKPAHPYCLWAVAVCLSVVSFCRAEADSLKLLPALTPLLLWTERRWEPGTELTDSSFATQLYGNKPIVLMISLFSVLTLTDGSYRGILPSLVVTSLSYIVYSAFLAENRQRSVLPTLPSFARCIDCLAPRVTFVLVLGAIARVSFIGFPPSNAISSLLLGITKSLSWTYTAQSAYYTSWSLTAMLSSFSLLSTRNPFSLSSDSQALSHVLASLLSLAQIFGFTPKQVRPTWVLIVAAVLPLVPYSANIVAIRNAQLEAQIFSESNSHPVEVLFNRSKIEFQQTLARQSTTFEMASREYRSRYGLDPPPGFEGWFQLARSLESPLIDDFDTIHRSIYPFRAFSGKELQKAIYQAQALQGMDLWLCRVSSATLKTECSHPRRKFDRHISQMFNNILANATELPDVQFLVNHIDEPRVLDHFRQGGISVENCSHKPVWDLVTKGCGQFHEDTEAVGGMNTFGLPFVTNISSYQDLCQHPDYKGRHGLTSSPVSFRPIAGPLPVLSTGTLSTMKDILFPSPAYTETEFIYNETYDIEWDLKRNNLYWAGSTTGGYATDSNWQLFHRQRFVEVAQNLRKNNYYLRVKDGVAKRVRSSFLNGRLFNVAFTRIFQCQRQSCRDQDAYFGTKSWVDKDEALKSKLAFDIDGNGISGRFYKLLASRSVPLKQTLLQEWHDDRLMPWLHYVPVSQSMEELPELVSFLTLTESGQRIGKEISVNGREWYARSFRQADLGLYMYRLLLEMARLQDAGRMPGN